MNTTIRHEHEEYVTAAGRDFRCLFRREIDGGYRVTCRRCWRSAKPSTRHAPTSVRRSRPGSPRTTAGYRLTCPGIGSPIRPGTPRICRPASRRRSVSRKNDAPYRSGVRASPGAFWRVWRDAAFWGLHRASRYPDQADRLAARLRPRGSFAPRGGFGCSW